MVDTQDLKSCGQQCPYGFDSRPKHRAEAGRKASWFPVRLSSLYPTYPSRSIYLQSNRLNLIAVAAVAVVVIAVVDMVAWSWMFSNGCCGHGCLVMAAADMAAWSWLFGHGCSDMVVRTWLFGHGCSVMAVAAESHHITISSYHTSTSYRAVSPYFLLLHSLLHPLPHPLPHSKWTGSPYLAYSDRLHASAAFPAVFR